MYEQSKAGRESYNPEDFSPNPAPTHNYQVTLKTLDGFGAEICRSTTLQD